MRGQGRPRSVSASIADHLRGNIVGYLALLIALSGTAYAANKVTSGQIARDAVRSRHIKDGQVNSADVADNSLTGADIDESSLQIAQQTLQVGPDSLGGTQIDESSLDPGVLQRRISGSCGANQTISAVDPSGSVTCHTDADSAPGPGSITSTEIANGTITDSDVSPSAAIAGSKLATQMGILTGRINHLSTAAFSTYFASVTGITDESTPPSDSETQTLTPATSLTASGLAVAVDAAPGAGTARTFTLEVNGVDAFDCTIFGTSQTCDSGNATVTIPPGSRLSLRVFSLSPGGPLAAASAMFGLQVR